VFGLRLLDLVEDASKQFNIGDRPPDIGVTVCHPTPIVANWFVLQTINIKLAGQAVKRDWNQRRAELVENESSN
jgi:hypothetical protein